MLTISSLDILSCTLYNDICVFQLKKMLIQLTCLLHSQNALRNKEMEMRLKQQSSKIATLKRKVCQLETTVGKNNLSVERKMLISIFLAELFLNGFTIIIEILAKREFEASLQISIHACTSKKFESFFKKVRDFQQLSNGFTMSRRSKTHTKFSKWFYRYILSQHRTDQPKAHGFLVVGKHVSQLP